MDDTSDLYAPRLVRELFDEMAATYGCVNLIASFGFSALWRRQCVDKVPFSAGQSVFDLMSGMGELWPSIVAKCSHLGSLNAVDFSHEMCKRSMRQTYAESVNILETDILSNEITSESADVIVSAFGLKTFSDEQKAVLACEIARILKRGGHFSLMEISVPPDALLRLPYMFYLRCIIPIIGRLFLGNPDNYRKLWVYTDRFVDASLMCELLKGCGLAVKFERYFFGCATGVTGVKP